MDHAEIPQPPAGNSNVFYGISENFSFHASPESFIKARIKQSQRDEDDRSIFRAKILNRNVAVVSSYEQVQQILNGGLDNASSGEPTFVASTAYDKLMGPFFPSPNMLLMDGASHADMKRRWDHIKDLPKKISSQVHEMTIQHFNALTAKENVDLYESMKRLSWKILFAVFLDLKETDPQFDEIEALHEDLLRGQFSLFPISVNTGFWHSPRKKGIDARVKLQDILINRMTNNPETFPFKATDEQSAREIADHVLLFTSSLAAKGMSSLLTAFLLNIFVFRNKNDESVAQKLKSSDTDDRRSYAEAVLQETKRLSAPIVGVMRRVTRDAILSEGSSKVLIPKGWDCWIYFVGASRDPSTFGPNANDFDPDRYLDRSTVPPLAFGTGPKLCLGHDLASSIVLDVTLACVEGCFSLKGEVNALGVRKWLGWDSEGGIEDWANDVKQLPVQKPRAPIRVTVSRS